MAFSIRSRACVTGMTGREIVDFQPCRLKFLFQKGFHAVAAGAHAAFEA